MKLFSTSFRSKLSVLSLWMCNIIIWFSRCWDIVVLRWFFRNRSALKERFDVAFVAGITMISSKSRLTWPRRVDFPGESCMKYFFMSNIEISCAGFSKDSLKWIPKVCIWQRSTSLSKSSP